MLFFLDSANVKEIEELMSFGIVDGITTNPSLIVKEGKDFYELARNICSIVSGPVSLEVSATTFDGMLSEGEKLLNIGEHVVLKLPITWDGIKACKHFAAQGKDVNMTLCFSSTQALITAKAGAKYVSPFVGRIDDIGHDGLSLIEDIAEVFNNYSNLETHILAASVRNVYHIYQLSKIGVSVVTMAPKVMQQLLEHPLTDIGLKKFSEDWLKSGLKI